MCSQLLVPDNLFVDVNEVVNLDDVVPELVQEFLVRPLFLDAQAVVAILFSQVDEFAKCILCLLYTSPSPRDRQKSRMPSSA